MKYRYKFSRMSKDMSYISGLEEQYTGRDNRVEKQRIFITPTKQDMRNKIKTAIAKAMRQAHDIGWTADNGDKIMIGTIKEHGPLGIRHSKHVEHISRLIINGETKRIIKRAKFNNPHFVKRCDTCSTQFRGKSNQCSRCRIINEIAIKSY